ncbi:site-specific DNA-methyltransferase [uncultured Enterovirga sp.]|uniref:site-specific DNA-methyltransferase n=1 Tax=uncultured Enterovirga sp. TaxID=2026352 RepID=UPI0035CBAD19
MAGLKVRDQRRRKKHAGVGEAASGSWSLHNDLLPRLQLADRPLCELILPKRNVRKSEAGHVREVANAISALGFTVPVIIDQQGNVIDGAVRVEAAKLLGLPRVPCILAEHLTVVERRVLRLAANRLAEKGTWDLDELKLELEELILEDAPIEITGFELSEIDVILADEDAEAVEEGPLAPEEDAQAVSRVGDVFRLGSHRVVCGDATQADVLQALMAGDVARMVFTDQPYNLAIVGHVTGGKHREFAMASGEMSKDEFGAFNAAWIGAALAHLMDGGLLATFIDWRGVGSVSAAALAAGLEQLNLIVWAKTNAGMGSLYRSQHELLPLFKKGTDPHVNNVDLGRKGRWRSNLWTYAGASSMGSDARQGLQHHPTVKPVAMLVDALQDVTHRGEIVLDPFLGSGSTLIAAEKSGRICRGIELDPLYVDVIAHRYEEVTGRPALLESTGEPFTALAKRRKRETDPEA